MTTKDPRSSTDNFTELKRGDLQFSGKKKQHKQKLFGPDFPRTFLTLTPGCPGPGVKKFLPITGAAEKRTSRCGRPRFSARTSMTRRVLEKLCTKNVCVDFLVPKFTTTIPLNGHGTPVISPVVQARELTLSAWLAASESLRAGSPC